MNNRQFRFRIKYDRCWDDNEMLKKLPTHFAKICPTCKKIYSEMILDGYKLKYSSLTIK